MLPFRQSLREAARVSAGLVRVSFWTAALLLTPIVLVGVAFLARCSLVFRPPNCEQRQPLSRATSPDGAWVATLYDNICSDGAFVTVTFVTAEITRPNDQAAPMPADGNTVFGMDRRPSGVPKPLAVTWTTPRRLQITLPNDAPVGTQKQAFGDISISYKYVPDDPIERACLKKWYFLPFDQQQRYNHTNGRKNFITRCRADSEAHQTN